MLKILKYKFESARRNNEIKKTNQIKRKLSQRRTLKKYVIQEAGHTNSGFILLKKWLSSRYEQWSQNIVCAMQSLSLGPILMFLIPYKSEN